MIHVSCPTGFCFPPVTALADNGTDHQEPARGEAAVSSWWSHAFPHPEPWCRTEPGPGVFADFARSSRHRNLRLPVETRPANPGRTLRRSSQARPTGTDRIHIAEVADAARLPLGHLQRAAALPSRSRGSLERWRPIAADGIELFRVASVTVSRYRYRASTSPPRGSLRTPSDGRDRGEPVASRGARRVRREVRRNGPGVIPAPRSGPTQRSRRGELVTPLFDCEGPGEKAGARCCWLCSSGLPLSPARRGALRTTPAESGTSPRCDAAPCRR